MGQIQVPIASALLIKLSSQPLVVFRNLEADDLGNMKNRRGIKPTKMSNFSLLKDPLKGMLLHFLLKVDMIWGYIVLSIISAFHRLLFFSFV